MINPSASPAATADYNLRILWTLARYVEDRFGGEGLAEVASAAGLQATDFNGKNRWISAEGFERVLAKARSLMADDEEFKRACIHRMRESYGPLRYVLWATSPGAVFSMAAKQYKLISTCGDIAITEQGRTWAHMVIRSRVPISRLNCLARQAQSAQLPTLWGLPSAHLREVACIALGDESCELRYSWYEARRWLPVLIGAALFALIGYAFVRAGMASVPTPIAMAIVGGSLGYLFEVRRAERLNDRTREEVMGALRQVASEENEARRELLEIHHRQKDWTRLVEEEMRTRTGAIQHIVDGMQDLQQARASTLLGFSHDLRNPLQIIQASAEFLQGAPGVKGDADAAESTADIALAVERMRLMLGELVQVAKSQREFVPMAPKRVPTAELSEALRRRLRALVHGRDVRSSVFATREAPEAIEIDPLAFDRIVDNLLTNAAKYTERGSIVIELDGTPGFLVIKVSDTGLGMEAGALERVFDAGGSSAESRRGDSFGVGLSVVVQLLDQIGGRLEVMSKAGSGTTFWVRLPLQAHQRPEASEEARPRSAIAKSDAALSRVVSIRKLSA